MKFESESRMPWLSGLRIALALTMVAGVVLVFLALIGDRMAAEVKGSLEVIHAVFGHLVWPLGLLAAVLTRRLSGASGWAALVGLTCFATGALIVFTLSWIVARPAVLNAVPVIEHPLFGAATGLVVTGFMLTFAASVVATVRGRGILADGLAWYPLVPILAAAGLALWVWQEAAAADQWRLASAYLVAQAVWPSVQASLLVLGWLLLIDTHDLSAMSARWRHGLMLSTLIPAGLLLGQLRPSAVLGTELYQQADVIVSWATWPGVLACGVMILVGMVRRRHLLAGSRVPLIFAGSFGMALFAALTAVLDDATGGLYRAQVHWSAAALLLTYLPLIFGAAKAPARGAAQPSGPESVMDWVPFVTGLLLAGWGFAIPGLMPIADRLADGPFAAEWLPGLARVLNVLGAVLVLSGGGWRVYRVLQARALRSRGAVRAWLDRLDARIRAVAMTVFAVALIGGIIALLPSPDASDGAGVPIGEPSAQHTHAVEQIRTEVQQRFDQGVVMLRARRYDEAATAFHRVLALSPEMPEAHVNMGFAMLGKQDYQLALDFFEGATELRSDQLNAYYGMALALEGLGRFDAAAGAMRTYQHLTTPDDPFLPKVSEKLEEYERRRGGATVPSGQAARQ